MSSHEFLGTQARTHRPIFALIFWAIGLIAIWLLGWIGWHATRTPLAALGLIADLAHFGAFAVGLTVFFAVPERWRKTA